jgi:hypothetical protein
MNYNQIPDWYLNFRRALDRFTRMATVVALVAALVSFPEPQYRNAVEVHTSGAAFKHFCAEITGGSQGWPDGFRTFCVWSVP